MKLRAWVPGLILGAGILAACHLFLDPDELVANAGDSGSDTGAPDVDLRDAGGLATLDGEVPTCVPNVPLGVQAIAVVGGAFGNPPACPVGYEPTGQHGYGNLTGNFACSAGSCACGTTTGTFTCDHLELAYTKDDKCSAVFARGPINNQSAGTVVCGSFQLPDGGPDYAKLVGTVTSIGSACPPSGDASIEVEAGAVGLEVQLCRPMQMADATGCPSGNTALPAAKNAVSCYASTSPSCDPAYQKRYSFALAPDLEDKRSCRCECDLASAPSCSPSGFQPADPGCGDPSGPVLTPVCRPIADYGNDWLKVPKGVFFDAGTSSCTPRAERQGNLGFKTDQLLFLCCLSECGTCEQLAVSPGGACADVAKTNADAAIQTCVANACATACANNEH